MAKTIKYSFAIFIFEAILIFVFGNPPMKYLGGLLLGYVFNLIFFRIMYLNAKSKVEMQAKRAKRFSIINYTARYAITGVILYIAAVSPKLSLLTCFIGLLSIKLAIYVSTIVDYFKSAKN